MSQFAHRCAGVWRQGAHMSDLQLIRLLCQDSTLTFVEAQEIARRKDDISQDDNSDGNGQAATRRPIKPDRPSSVGFRPRSSHHERREDQESDRRAMTR